MIRTTIYIVSCITIMLGCSGKTENSLTEMKNDLGIKNDASMKMELNSVNGVNIYFFTEYYDDSLRIKSRNNNLNVDSVIYLNEEELNLFKNLFIKHINILNKNSGDTDDGTVIEFSLKDENRNYNVKYGKLFNHNSLSKECSDFFEMISVKYPKLGHALKK